MKQIYIIAIVLINILGFTKSADFSKDRNNNYYISNIAEGYCEGDNEVISCEKGKYLFYGMNPKKFKVLNLTFVKDDQNIYSFSNKPKKIKNIFDIKSFTVGSGFFYDKKYVYFQNSYNQYVLDKLKGADSKSFKEIGAGFRKDKNSYWGWGFDKNGYTIIIKLPLSIKNTKISKDIDNIKYPAYDNSGNIILYDDSKFIILNDNKYSCSFGVNSCKKK